MIKSERKEKVLEIVKQKNFATLEEIAKQLSISESTIRRDIAELDKEGLLSKERGGASISKSTSFSMVDQNLIVREKLHANSKLAIAKKALSLISQNSTIFIDAGSSTLALTKLLPNNMPITIVTDSLTIAKIASEKNICTYLIGGVLKVTTDATVGPMAEEELSKFNFKQAFMGANAVNPKSGFMTPDFSEASLKKKAICQAEQAIFLIDKTKFDQKSIVSFADLKNSIVVTDFVDTRKNYSTLTILEVQ